MSILPIRRALVMDGDSAHAFFAAGALKVLGVPDVETFQLAGVALKTLRETPFDLALVDLETLGAPSFTPKGSTLFIGMRPSLTRADPRKLLEMAGTGVDALLEKPFTTVMLLRKLEEALAGSAGRRLKIVELRRPSPRATLFGVPRFAGSPRFFDPV